MSAFKKCESMRQETTALWRKRRGATRPSALTIQLDAELRLERYETIADTLFGNTERVRRRANLPNAREFNECSNLIRAEMGESGHGETIQRIRL